MIARAGPVCIAGPAHHGLSPVIGEVRNSWNRNHNIQGLGIRHYKISKISANLGEGSENNRKGRFTDGRDRLRYGVTR